MGIILVGYFFELITTEKRSIIYVSEVIQNMGTYEKFKAIAKDKSMYQISKETGISQSTLSDWKLGKSNLKIDKLKILAEYLGVEVSVLIED